MKPVVWLGDSLDVVRGFPPEARTEVGRELRRVQSGLDPDDWKSIASIGLGVKEIRVHIGTEHRVFYVAKFAESMYVLHAITKKTQRTPKKEIELATRRYRQLANERKAK